MAYSYDDRDREFRQSPPPRPPRKEDNDLGSWILIIFLFIVAWPAGLAVLLSKVLGNDSRRKNAARSTRSTVSRSDPGKSQPVPGPSRDGFRRRAEGHQNPPVFRKSRPEHEDCGPGAAVCGAGVPGGGHRRCHRRPELGPAGQPVSHHGPGRRRSGPAAGRRRRTCPPGRWKTTWRS